MFDFGWQEFLVVAFVLVLVVGPKDLPRVLKTFTKFTSQARRISSEFTKSLQEMSDNEELKDVKKVLQDAKSGDFEEFTEILDNSVSSEMKSIGEEIETDLKEVYDETQKATSVKEG